MIDREKIIKGLECCCLPTIYDCDHKCPYKDLYEQSGFNNCMAALLPDAFALLKAQEPKAAISNPEKYGDYLRHCPSCEAVLPLSSQYGRAKFCHLCGQAVKWE